MGYLLQAIVTGAVSFAATNIDDIFVLVLFFGEKGKSLKARHVVVGQYLGFSALVAISLIGYFVRYVAPREWIGWLGLLPVAIGIKKPIDWWRGKGGVAHDPTKVKPATSGAIFSVLTVAAVTFANGADNIGIYTPLFATIDLGRLVLTLVVFFVLVGVWCAVAYYLGSRSLVVKILERYGNIIVPFVLIGLGLLIFYESGTLALVIQIHSGKLTRFSNS